MRSLLSILLFVAFGIPLYAQPFVSISGVVKEKNGESLPGAFVLLKKDTGNVMSTITDADGLFLLERIQPGSYSMHISAMGFTPYESPLTVYESAVVVPDIELQPQVGQMDEVVVRGQKPVIEIAGDKIIVNVENSITASGSSILEVLQTAPGVTIDADDNLALQGKQGVVVWIDGKPSPMQGTDLAMMLRSMPAGTVEKIELIARPGARYDAEGSAGIINIKTKSGKGQGWNAVANLTYGQGRYPKYGAGLNLNYRNRKIKAYASYTYSYKYWFNHLKLNRRFLTTDQEGNHYTEFSYLQDNFSLLNFKNHLAQLNLDYSLTGKTTLGISLNGSSNHYEPKADNMSKALDAKDRLLYYFNTTGRHSNAHYNYAANINMRHAFDSTGKMLSADLDYAAFTNNSRQDFVTHYIAPDGSPFMPDYFLKSKLDGITVIQSLKSDYVHPLGAHTRLEAGAKLSKVYADNEPLFYEKVNDNYELDTKRSNHFIYNEQITAAYANLNKEWKLWNVQLGMRMEHTYARWQQQTMQQKFDTSYLQLFPYISLSHPVGPKHELSLSLNRRIERPDYQQLNPFRYFIDKTTYRSGDPYLQPASYYSASLSHIFNKRLITTVSYGINKGVIAGVIQPSDTEDSVTVQTAKNLDQMTFVGINGAYILPIASWWNNVFNVNVYYAHYKGTVAHTPLNAGGYTFDIKTTHVWSLPGDYAIEASFLYRSKERYAYMDIKPLWMLNAGIQKHIWNKRATIKLNIQDIFYKGYPRATSDYKDYSEDFVAERETRVANISFVYQLGKTAMPAMGKHTGGAEEEKRRANIGNS